MILAIETSSRQLGVAVFDGEQAVSSYEILADYPHAVELPGAVTRVLKEAGVALPTLHGLVVDLGPGSFTGLRIGLAFIKALAFAHRFPVVGISSLQTLAANLPLLSQTVCPILDAKQQNVYAALFRMEGPTPVRLTDDLLGPADQILERLGRPAVFLGDGCRRFREAILRRFPDAVFAPQEVWLPKAAALARLGWVRLAEGKRDDPATLVPHYLYPLDCSVRGPDRPTSVLPKAVQAA